MSTDVNSTGAVFAGILAACLLGFSVSPVAGAQVNGEPTAAKAANASVVINEFLASNARGIVDEDGNSSDWIELYNVGREAVALEGWSLTDDQDKPKKWVFPNVTIAAKGYLLVFASGKNRKPAVGKELHTNFKLSKSGEYLALYNDNEPPKPVAEFAPAFPEQTVDSSYGLPGEGSAYAYLEVPTPSTANDRGDRYFGFAEAPRFSVERGFYDNDISLELTSPAPDATILYTVGGADPTPEKGTKYKDPIEIVESTVVRAVAYRKDHAPSRAIAHTYILRAPALHKALPALIISGDPQESLFEPNGVMAIVKDDTGETIYNNALGHGRDYERPVSVEFINPKASDLNEANGFYINCGIRIHGSEFVRNRYRRGDDWNSCLFYSNASKYSFRFYFRDEYGSGQFNFPLFPLSQAETFSQIVVRGGHNDGCNPFIKDELARRLHLDMGAKASTGTFVNLFINGKFKSYYNLCERLNEHTFQQWYASDAQWDVVSIEAAANGDPSGKVEAKEGDLEAWTAMMDYARSNDLSVAAHYEKVAGMLDIEAFIDYLILEIYSGNLDWPGKNWTAARERSKGTDLGKYRFYLWDCEAAFWSIRVELTAFNNFPYERGGLNGEELPIPWLYRALRVNDTFRQLFAHRIQLHMLNDGALTDDNIMQRYDELAEIIAPILPREIMGIDDFVSQRRDIVLNAFAEEGLYSPVENEEEK